MVRSHLATTVLVCALAACAPSITRRPSASTDRGEDTDTGDDTDTAVDTDSDTDTGPCPAGMALVDDRVCVDRYEGSLEVFADGAWTTHSPFLVVDGLRVRAVSIPDVVPQAYLSGDEAEAACQASGKRLCTSDEWVLACSGIAGRTFPYGDAYDPGACNDTYVGTHPVVDYFGTSEGVWDPASMNDPGINQQPDTVARTGAFADCVTPDGVHDLHGNLHEWVADASGTFRGGFYADARINGEGCAYRTVAHGRGYHDYSTGFRCCADPR